MKSHYKTIEDINVLFRVNDALETVSYTFTLNGETYTHTIKVLDTTKKAVSRMRKKAKQQIEEVRKHEHSIN